MTFEKALEAMKQGKKVKRNSWDSNAYIQIDAKGYVKDENDSLFCLDLGTADLDEWEIYEEPEMTNEKAITLLNRAIIVVAESGVKRIGCCTSENIIEAIQFAIHSLENQNEPKIFFDGNLSEKELEELHGNLKECKLEANPEKKCECKCNHTVVDADLQEKMKQALKDKFFELAKEDVTQFRADLMLAILQSMCGIYKLLYP